MQELVLNYLKVEPRFREREAKNRGIADLLIIKYDLKIDRRLLADVITEAASMDRAWRKILAENEELRGKDYGDKDMLEQEKMLELGYTPGIEENIKTLRNHFEGL